MNKICYIVERSILGDFDIYKDYKTQDWLDEYVEYGGAVHYTYAEAKKELISVRIADKKNKIIEYTKELKEMKKELKKLLTEQKKEEEYGSVDTVNLNETNT